MSAHIEKLLVAALVTALPFVAAQRAGGVSPITSIQAHYDSLDDESEDFAAIGAGSGAFPTGTTYLSRFTVGQFDNLIIDAFDVGTNNFIFRQLAQSINIVRVDNASVTGAHQILLYDQEGAIQNGTNIALSSQFVPDMEGILLADVINRGVDNVFCNTGNGDGNNNNIERIDYIFGDGYPAFGNLLAKGFMVMDRGGNDALQIAAILSVDSNGLPASFSTPVLMAQTNWGNSGIILDTIVYRGYEDDFHPSADVGAQPLTGQYIDWTELGIATNTLVYGYSLVAADVPATQNWLDVSGFPLNTTEGSTAGGLDLMSGGALVLDERQNATLGDYVWNDLNQNGLQDANEPGLSNVLVRVWDSTGTNLAGQARSDENGQYFVFALPPDIYQMEVVLPTNYVFTLQDIGPDDTIDSDIDTNTGRSGFFELFTSTTSRQWDAGMYLPPTDLGVSKTVNDATPHVATSLVFTITLTNFGPYDVDSVRLSDLLPAGLTFSNANTTLGSYNGTSGVWTLGFVTNGATAQLVITAGVDVASAGLILTNTAAIAFADRPDTNLANDEASVVIAIRSLDLGVTKTVDDPLPDVLDFITYTVSITNNGPDTAANVTLTDVVPAGLSLTGATASVGTYTATNGLWTIGTLGNGAFATLILTARVDGTSAGLVLTNTATANVASLGDTNAANNSASVVITVLGADLAITKTPDNSAPYPGSNVVYTITLTNNGPTLATGVTVTERLTNGLTYAGHVASSGSYDNVSGIWTVGTLQAGASETLLITATVATGAVNTLITNKSAITSSGVADGNTANNTGTAVIAVSSLRIFKSSSVTNQVFPGSNITYTIVVTNAGSLVQTNVVVTDPIPTGATYVAGTAQVTGPGIATNFTLDRFETAAFTHQNGSVNWAGNWIEVGESDGANAGDVAVVSDGTNRVLRLQDNDNGGEGVRRQVNLADATEAYLNFYYRKVGLDGSTDFVAVYASSNGGSTFVELTRFAGPNNNASYVFTNINISSFIATNTQVRFLTSANMGSGDIVYFNDIRVEYPVTGTNTIDGGTPPNLATNWVLQPGQFLTVTFQVQVDNPVAVTQIVNTAYASSESQVLPISATVRDPIAATDLGIRKTVNNATPNAGSNVIYTILVTNNGPLNASSVQVTELLTNGLSYVSHVASRGTYATNTGIWNVGVLTNGTFATLTLTARVSTNPAFAGTSITNVSTITGSSLADTITTNNSATAVVTVVAADLAVQKTVDDNSPLIGGGVTYTVVVTNQGPSGSTSVQLTDLVPSGLLLTNVSASQGSYVSTSGIWTVGSLSAGGSASLTLSASVTSTVIGAFITNRAFVSAVGVPDLVSTNNTGVVVIVTTSADPLTIRKTSSAGGSSTTVGQALPGYTNVYTIVVSNPTTFAHSGIIVEDAVPAGMTFVASSTVITAPEYKDWIWQDTFASRAYNNNHGNTNWIGNWDESESGDNPLAGNIQIVIDPLRGVTYTLQFQGGGVTQSIMRNADLGGFTNGILSFEYRRESLESGDFVLAQISSNRLTGPWTTLLRIEGPADDAAYTYTNFDIRAWLSTNVTVRFVTTNTAMGSGDIVWIDDVTLDAARETTTTRDGGLPPTLATNLSLLPGGVATITYGARVNDPPTVTQVVNRASVTSDQQVVTMYASVTDRVELADIGVAKSASVEVADEGETVAFTIVATNFGPFGATGVQVTDALPAGFTYASNVVSQGSYASGNGLWTVGSLGISNAATLTLYATLNAGTAGLTLTNVATVTRVNQGDLNPSNDVATATVRVVPAFIITDCNFNTTNNAVEIFHLIVSTAQVYDLLYVDAVTFHNSLSNQWALADRRAGGKLVDTGAVGRTPPMSMSEGVLRFYRISAATYWEQSPRRASEQVMAFGAPRIHPGQNWVRPWGIPCNNTFKDVFRHILPAGADLNASTRVMWFQRAPLSVPATQEVWLANGEATNQWIASWPTNRAGENADAWPIPYDQGFVVELPTNQAMKRMPMIYAVPPSPLVQVIPGGNKYSLVSVNLPESLHPAQLNLVEAGFTGGTVPIFSDWIWKFNRNNQTVPDVLWFCTTNNTWRFTSPAPQYPVVPTNYFRSDDAIVIQTRRSAGNLSWTNRFHYSTPTRDMNP